jgi:hypothetical protein
MQSMKDTPNSFHEVRDGPALLKIESWTGQKSVCTCHLPFANIFHLLLLVLMLLLGRAFSDL